MIVKGWFFHRLVLIESPSSYNGAKKKGSYASFKAQNKMTFLPIMSACNFMSTQKLFDGYKYGTDSPPTPHYIFLSSVHVYIMSVTTRSSKWFKRRLRFMSEADPAAWRAARRPCITALTLQNARPGGRVPRRRGQCHDKLSILSVTVVGKSQWNEVEVVGERRGEAGVDAGLVPLLHHAQPWV